MQKKVSQSYLQLSLLLVSAVLIALQINIIQMYSVTQWHHFAYMIISVALLGFGVSGTFISLFKETLLRNINSVLAFSLAFYCFTVVVCPWLATRNIFRFDSYLIFYHPSELFKLFSSYLLLFLPFFFCGLYIGLIFTKYTSIIGKLYFYNLFGSGLGGFLIVLLLWIFPNSVIFSILSAIALIPALMIVSPESKKLYRILLLMCSVIIVINLVKPFAVPVSEYKGLSRSLNMPDTEVIYKKNSPLGKLHIVESLYARSAPTLSLNFRGEVPVRKNVFLNGEILGPIINWDLSDEDHIYNYSTIALPFIFSDPESILVLNSGTGDLISLALANGFAEITAVEANTALIGSFRQLFGEEGYIECVYDHPSVKLKKTEARNYLAGTGNSYGLITIPVIDSFGGSSGLYALEEEYLLTKESFNLIWNNLDENGLISISFWLDYPPKYSMKILSTLVELLLDNGVYALENHIAAVNNWAMATVVVSRNQITTYDSALIRNFAEEMSFDLLILPDLEPQERNRFNIIDDTTLFSFIDDTILSKESPIEVNRRLGQYYRDYTFNIAPATDNKPFFRQFLKLSQLGYLLDQMGARNIPFIELGYLIVIATLVQVVLLSLVMIILPLLKLGWAGGFKIWTFLYFFGIGIGYMMIEIVLIQKCIVYLGNPIYSVAITISGLLVFSGIGSLCSKFFLSKKNVLLSIIAIVVILITLYLLIFDLFLIRTISLPFYLKTIMLLLSLFPLGFFMGMPFPIGLRLLKSRQSSNLPWAWGINGFASVVSAVLATVIALEMGYVYVFVTAIIMYTVTAIVTKVTNF